MAKHVKSLLGAWAFLLGVILAFLLGLFAIGETWMTTVLVVLGVIVGLLNVGVKESEKFLFAGVALVIVSLAGSMGLNLVAASWLINITNALLVLFVPATIVVALKTVFSVAKG